MKFPRMRFWIRTMVALVAVAIVLVVAFRGARTYEPDLRDRCSDRLRQLALAIPGYRYNHSGSYPPGTASDSDLPPEKLLSWITLLYSFFDESQNVNFLFDRSAPWDAAVNLVPTIRSFDRDESGHETHSDYVPPGLLPYRVLLCPANPSGRDSGVTHFVGISGIGLDSPILPTGHPRAGIFGYDRRTFVGDIEDGLADTMMLAETAGDIGPWSAGGPSTVRALDPARKPYIGKADNLEGTTAAA